MCGIAGFWDRRSRVESDLRAPIEKMTVAIAHRGPDDSGVFVDEAAGVALGSRRLAIIDLSDAGHQPMATSDGRFVIAYNGEIYNFGDLRRELASRGVRFRGSSDTEVLLTGIQVWGLKATLQRCNGMFALAVWDRSERRLQLARDRFGEKPLYYGWCGGAFLFGSELKALAGHPAFNPEIDRDALALYFRHNCVPAPYTIYREFSQLYQGSIFTLDATSTPGEMPAPEKYWALSEVAESGARSRSVSGAETVDELEEVLSEAVRIRMHADVPLGAFLSGGIDSSIVVALMQANRRDKVRSFTIAFEDSAYDESPDARRVADHLGTEHVELVVTDKDALEVIPKLPQLYDEPFADSSQIPTALLARLARQHVTVALSGDGGDEMFGGYNRYAWAESFWGRIAAVPRPVRHLAGAALDMVPPKWWDRAFERADPLLPKSLRVRTPGTKIQKVARVLDASDLLETYRRLSSHIADPSRLVLGSNEPATLITSPSEWPKLDEVELMLYLDSMTYLPDDILTKVDRATMGASLENRVPFLDPNVAELAWRLPFDVKVKNGTGKWLLRQLLYRYVPPEIVDRPKMGFGIPLGAWLRGPLRAWAEDLLSEDRLRREGYLSPEPIRRMWIEHLSGRADRQYELWDVLMFQAWLAEPDTNRVRS
jgi:asparagine synthase (glutamine-hydrolysing)